MGRIATIGTFDGVHRGHQTIISQLKKMAKRSDSVPLVVTFNRHPLEIIAPERAPKRLMLPDEEEIMLRKQGVDVMMLPFTEQTRALTARQWMMLLRDEYNVDELLIGYDNTFGCDGRSLTFDDYHSIAQSLGMKAEKGDMLPGVCSSVVRKAILVGNVAEAAEMLGRNYSLKGIVVHGDALGRTIGFPTANLELDRRRLIPAVGVYAVTAVLHTGHCVKGVANIGVRPTVTNSGEMRVEIHLPDWSGNLYDTEMKVEFVRRIRNEQRFETVESLLAQIHDDVNNALSV
jgi:riboflavin kinase/FMN adenylyltransferase